MNPDWNCLLQSSALFDLSHLGLIQVEGEDSRTFMQGQFTNDARDISPGHSQLSAHCSPKGRMLALFRIIERDGAFLLQLPGSVLPAVLKRLPFFVLRSKVRISDASRELARIGLAGVGAEELIEECLGEVPARVDDVIHRDGISCIRLSGGLPRFELLLPFERAPAFWERLAESAPPSSAELWKLLAIRAGEPVVYPETAEDFVPQMANMQLVNGLSFTKGCYTGQEVVARMHYLGKLKRRMYRARIEGACPQPGEDLFSPTSGSGQGAGRIVEAAPLTEGACEVLAVCEVESHDQGGLRLRSAEGPPLTFLELPYSLEDEGNPPPSRPKLPRNLS
ncbi:MAG: folate-binding protein YgfZ [Gammaproteobacteria bacterium]|nr:folate-binding protein YgfZ [Gammaproteobacteria bacterium]MBU1653302.1 folate-binding protein YgfZ [Gammaproteobacteria bacterium]MBU1962442.1 folate-binding protein YgfZ [Gammaproteobacteria bacterium]